jgi:hypothetical protein
MSISGIFLLLAFLGGCALFVAWPFLFGSERPGSPAPNASAIASLQAEHEAILTAIRDLDFDYQTGKFTEEEYRTQRESLVQRGVQFLKRIDTEQSAAIEAAVQARRKKPS